MNIDPFFLVEIYKDKRIPPKKNHRFKIYIMPKILNMFVFHFFQSVKKF